jgi:hypothetical protein
MSGPAGCCRAGNVGLLSLALFDQNAAWPFEVSLRNSGDHRIGMAEAHRAGRSLSPKYIGSGKATMM